MEQNTELNIDIYSLNKGIINQMPALTDAEIADRKTVIADFHKNANNNFYLLYGKEISYFTLFYKDSNSTESFEDVVVECLQAIGVLKSLDLNEDGVIEIWVAMNQDSTCLYLFPYDAGVERVRM